MGPERTLSQKVGLYAVGAVALFGAGYFGAHNSAPEPELTLRPVVPEVRPPVTEAEVVVHVAGGVLKPGLLHLPADSRVQDAIERAGGATKNADLEQVNLAAKLVDGTQVFIPEKNASPTQMEAPNYAPTRAAYASAPVKKEAPGHQVVSLNTATRADLDRLPGVGPATADKILQYRQEHGGFGSIDELLAVKGIGPKKLAAMRKWLKL